MFQEEEQGKKEINAHRRSGKFVIVRKLNIDKTSNLHVLLCSVYISHICNKNYLCICIFINSFLLLLS